MGIDRLRGTLVGLRATQRESSTIFSELAKKIPRFDRRHDFAPLRARLNASWHE
jgi:hypothetical protein